MDHTCGQTPNEENRILTNCDGCYLTAHGDGRIQGIKSEAQDIIADLGHMVREEFNPLKKPRKDDAENEWKTGQRVLTLLTAIEKKSAARQTKESTDHFNEVFAHNPPQTPEPAGTAQQDQPAQTQGQPE